MSYFDGIKVGDTVAWMKTPVQVVTVLSDRFCFQNSQQGIWWFADMEGCIIGDPDQTVFWQPVHIDPPARPKRKVSKTFQRFVTPENLKIIQLSGNDAITLWDDSFGGSPHPVTVTIEYEE